MNKRYLITKKNKSNHIFDQFLLPKNEVPILRYVEQNLIAFSIEEKTSVVNDKIEKYLNIKDVEKFNIIFFDPPFAENKYLDKNPPAANNPTSAQSLKVGTF